MSVPLVVVDTSVVVKWFVTENEPEAAEAQAIRDAHRNGLLTARILDLNVYELGNVLIRSMGWLPGRAANQIDDLLVICGPPLVPIPAWRRDACDLAAEHRLSYYDASFAAAARALDADLLSTDGKLVRAGLATTPTQFVEQHGDHIRNTP